MPGDIAFGPHTSYFGANLTAYVRNGTIPESRVDDMGMLPPFPGIEPSTDAYVHKPIATGILASWYLLHQDSPSYPRLKLISNPGADAATPSCLTTQVAREAPPKEPR
jgi:hypothetical protein